MKVLFIVTGIGLGDATRVDAVIDELMKRYPNTKVLIAGYDHSFAYFRGKYPTIRIKGYRMYGTGMRFRFWPFVARNFMLPFYWVYTAIKLRRALSRFSPDIIVSDFEPSGITIARAAKKKCVAVFGFDPYLYEDYRKVHPVSRLMALQAKYLTSLYDKANFVIIPSLTGRRKTLVYNYVNPIVGRKAAKLPSGQKLVKGLKLRKAPIVVMLGGSSFGVRLASAIAAEAKHFPEEQFIVFGGEKTKARAKNFMHIQYSKDFLKYLKASKAAVTLGGQAMLTECIALKKPMLILPIHNHIEQQLNAYAMREHAVVKEFSEATLRSSIRELIDRLPELQKKMDSLDVKPNGAEQAAALIRMLAKSKA